MATKHSFPMWPAVLLASVIGFLFGYYPGQSSTTLSIKAAYAQTCILCDTVCNWVPCDCGPNTSCPSFCCQEEEQCYYAPSCACAHNCSFEPPEN